MSAVEAIARSSRRDATGPRRLARRVAALPASLLTGGAILACLVGFAATAELFLADPNRQDLIGAYAPPGTAGHPLGTDPLGRDVLAWIGSSIRYALLVSVSVSTLSALLGVGVGIVAGYRGGFVDSVLMRLADLQLAVPPILLFIAVSAVIDTTLWSLILLLSAVGWVPYARIVRTRAQVERERSSVIAARLAGSSRTRVLVRHLLPSVATLALVLASLQLGYVLLWEASLSFLGLGIQPPATSLGFIIAQGRETLVDAWWVVVFPGTVLVLLVLASNLVGDGLRDLFDVDVDVWGHD